jgi:hypothetical protein
VQTHQFGGKVKISDFHDNRNRQEPPLRKWYEKSFIWRSDRGRGRWTGVNIKT